jgi:ABC-type nitrate/sulfonate/bicarbonate transport system permease component
MGIAWLVIVAAEMLVGGIGHRLLRVERMEQPVAHQRDFAIVMIGTSACCWT